MERYPTGQPSLFSEDPGSGELRPSARELVRMPGGLALTLDESEDEHIAHCRYCRVPSSRIAWSLTVAATDRRGLRIEIDDLRDLVGDTKATGTLETLGVNVRKRRWMAMDPTTILETPDFTFSPRSIHDRVALMGALRNALRARLVGKSTRHMAKTGRTRRYGIAHPAGAARGELRLAGMLLLRDLPIW